MAGTVAPSSPPSSTVRGHVNFIFDQRHPPASAACSLQGRMRHMRQLRPNPCRVEYENLPGGRREVQFSAPRCLRQCLRCRRSHSIGRTVAVPHGSAVPGARACASCNCKTCCHCTQQPGEPAFTVAPVSQGEGVLRSRHPQQAVSLTLNQFAWRQPSLGSTQQLA